VSEIADRFGVKSNIFGLHNEDLSKIAGTRLVTKCIQKHLDQGRRALAWASLPCTPWCLYHRIRESTRGPDVRRRLASARTHSLLTVRRFLSVVKRYSDTPLVVFAFEWPRHNLGWNIPAVQQLSKILDGSNR